MIIVYQDNTKLDEERKVERNVNEDGSIEESYLFNSEFQLKKKNYIWQNKYKPRKPRFFNRVHTVHCNPLCICIDWGVYGSQKCSHDQP